MKVRNFDKWPSLTSTDWKLFDDFHEIKVHTSYIMELLNTYQNHSTIYCVKAGMLQNHIKKRLILSTKYCTPNSARNTSDRHVAMQKVDGQKKMS